MQPDLLSLYVLMNRSRCFEEAIAQLWQKGLISGEMHLGTGEEAIMAGIVSQLIPGDAMALDHRGSAALLMRGVEPVSIVRELIGRADGLCGGQGGHMHLFSKEHLAASSGIVGAAAPTAAGFALAAQVLHPGSLSVAFFGEGAMNQGVLMEALNLAAAWKLPVLFVCKDDSWSITTRSQKMSGGTIQERVQGFGIPYAQINGLDVEAVWQSAHTILQYIRRGEGPFFLHASCVHLEGHFLGFQLLRSIRNPLKEMPRVVVPLIQSFLIPGGAILHQRWQGFKMVNAGINGTLRDPRQSKSNDPLVRIRQKLALDGSRLDELDQAIAEEIAAIMVLALQEAES